MGRLTLNMLLSFAQFEREVTGERIRDKIAASKKKGIWVGGVVPLGYMHRNAALAGLPSSSSGPGHHRKSFAPRHRTYSPIRPAERLVRAVQGIGASSAAVDGAHLIEATDPGYPSLKTHQAPAKTVSASANRSLTSRHFDLDENKSVGQTPRRNEASETKNTARDRAEAASPVTALGYVGAFRRRRKVRQNWGVAGGPGRNSNLQPDRYERPALTIELPALEGARGG